MSEDTLSSVVSQINGITYIPEDIVTAQSLYTFKNRMDKLWECDGVMFDPDVDNNISADKIHKD